MKAAALVGVTLTTFAVSAGVAQEASLWAGGVHAKYADSVLGTAGSVSLRLGGAFSRLAGSVDAGVSQFASGEWVFQASTYGAVIAAGSPTFNVGIAWAGEAIRIEGVDWSGSGQGGPLAAFTGGPVFGTVGAAAGWARLVDGTTTAIGTASLALQIRLHRWLILSSSLSGTTTDSIRYADATLGLRLAPPPLAISVSGGARRGDLSDDPWGQVGLELSMGPRATLEGAVGRYPSDIVGFTDGLFASLGVRIRLVGRRPRAEGPGAASPISVQPLEANRFRVQIRYAAPAARVELAGDWNGWELEPMTRESRDTWSAEVVALPGVHRFAIVVDGTRWTVPDGAASVPDEFGGVVSILVLR